MMTSYHPLIIEAAVSTIQFDKPLAERDSTFLPGIAGAKEALAAGASIVHIHHDWFISYDDGVEQLIQMHREILDAFPDALIYPDLMSGMTLWEKHGNLKALAEAGLLRMMPIEFGHTFFPIIDSRGLPSKSHISGSDYAEADELVEFANKHGVPISIGIYHPGMLHWVRAYARQGMFPRGSMIKIYFQGPYTMGMNQVPGIGVALPPTLTALNLYLEMMEGIDLPWMVACQGDYVLDTPVAPSAIERGGHIRVGIEDTAGCTDHSNGQTVEAVLAIARDVGRLVARPQLTACESA